MPETQHPLQRPPGVPDADWPLIEAFDRRCRRLGISDAVAATQLGYKSPSSWSTLRAGKYGASPAAILRKIRLLLEGERADADAIKTAPYTALDVSRDMAGYFDDRRDRHCMGFICGAPGIGKTWAIERYAESRENVLVITCVDGMTPMHLLKLVAAKIPIGLDKHGSRVAALDRVATALAALPRSLLIIDEADKLHAAQEAARDLWRPDGHCGHVWAGTAAFWNALNRRFASTAGQIARRFGDILSIVTMTDEDVERILAHYRHWPQPVLDRARELCFKNTGRLCDGLATAHRAAANSGLPVPTHEQIVVAFACLAVTNVM